MTTAPAIKKNPMDVGGIIQKEEFLLMTSLFKEKFPNEKSVLEVDEKAINQLLSRQGEISGARFMLGMQDSMLKDSLTFIMIPCNRTSLDKEIPNSIISPEGYVNNTNQLINLSNVWKQIANYIQHQQAYSPQTDWKKITRGFYFGINSLADFLKNNDATTIRFHLGLRQDTMQDAILNNQLSCIFELRNNSGSIFMDTGIPIPPPIEQDCLLTMAVKNLDKGHQEKILNHFRKFRSELLLKKRADLVEMYLNGIPSVVEAIEASPTREVIYRDFLLTMNDFNTLIEAGEVDTVIENYIREMNTLFNQHLFQ